MNTGKLLLCGKKKSGLFSAFPFEWQKNQWAYLYLICLVCYSSPRATLNMGFLFNLDQNLQILKSSLALCCQRQQEFGLQRDLKPLCLSKFCPSFELSFTILLRSSLGSSENFSASMNIIPGQYENLEHCVHFCDFMHKSCFDMPSRVMAFLNHMLYIFMLSQQFPQHPINSVLIF